jgi:hypothetical protein
VLAVVHGEGFVHRDLKPANVIVGRDGRPILVDFGLAGTFTARGGREVLERGGELLGSIAYMAPEQLRGEFVDARADLYALGCMLYEAMVGALPFDGSAAEVAEQVLATAPAPPSARGAAIDPDLERLILALLEKDPRRRPGYAIDVARGLAPAVGAPPPAAGAPYLYRAGFTGRADALARLVARLDRALAGQAGCALLVGESGVGKTRLAMESTRAAAARGFTVVTGECVADAGGAALRPLRPALQHLARAARQTGADFCRRVLGAHASVLSVVDPALRGLPGLGDLPPAPPLPAAAARERLVRATRATLAAWGREAPVLVVLDDLQWTDEVTLEVMVGWATEAPRDSAVLLIATVRSEEEPDVLRGLAESPALTRLPLARMERDAVGRIVGDMLAVDPAPPPLVAALHAHTEGNPFFVAEYLHTAVDGGLLHRDAHGRWRAVGEDPAAFAALALPTSVQALIARRLQQLTPVARAAMGAAAVLGREFDPLLAARMAELGEAEQAAALAALRAADMADAVAGGRWRIAHDKLREVAYAALDPEQRRILHGRAAAGIEALVATAPDPGAHFAVLAHHHAAAGAEEQAIAYLGRAGEHSLATGALERARAQLREAWARDRERGGSDRFRSAHWLRLLAQANAGDDLDAAVAYAAEAMRTLGLRVPRRAAGWALLLGGELARLTRRRRPAAEAAARERAVEAAQAAKTAATGYYFKYDLLRGMANSLRCIALADRAGEPERAALQYAQLGYVAGGARLHALAHRCFARAHACRDTAAADPTDFATGLYFQAMYEMGLGHWEAARTLVTESMTRLRDIGNLEEAEVAATILSNTLFYSSEVRAAGERSDEVRASAERRGHAQHHGWGLFLGGRSRLALGDVSGALELIERGYAILAPTQDFVSLVMCEGLLARARWCAGDRVGALHAAEALEARLAARGMVPLAQCLDGYGSLADVRLRHFAATPRTAVGAAARRATRSLGRFRRLFRIGTPAALRAAARFHWLSGRPTRARRDWERSLGAARALGMRIDEAGALLDLSAAGGPPAGREEALRLLRALGCADTTAEFETFPC